MKVNYEIVEEKPETHHWWVYVHTTPDGMHYVGVSTRKYTSQRWHPAHYKRTSLQTYIERFGWAAIEHTVVAYVNDEKLALLYEDALMNEFAMQGTLINKQGSGGHKRDNDEVWKGYQRDYQRDYRQSDHGKAVQRKASAKYYQSEHGKAVRAKYDQSERGRAVRAKRRAKPEGKIYKRVYAYNQTHTPIETPLEAKRKYLENGYIPQYIKHDDL